MTNLIGTRVDGTVRRTYNVTNDNDGRDAYVIADYDVQTGNLQHVEITFDGRTLCFGRQNADALLDTLLEVYNESADAQD